MHCVPLLLSFVATTALARSLPGAHKHLHARRDDVVYTTVTATNVVTVMGGDGGGVAAAAGSSSSAFHPVQAQAQGKKFGGGQQNPGSGGSQAGTEGEAQGDSNPMITNGPTNIPTSYPSTTSTTSRSKTTGGGAGGYSGGNSGGAGSVTLPNACADYSATFTTPAGSAYTGPDTGFSISLECGGPGNVFPTSNQNATKFTDSEDYVDLHNSYRAFHSVASLTLDSNAAASASAYASQCLNGDPGKDTQPKCPGGANFYGGGAVTMLDGNGKATATQVASLSYSDGIYAWYNELRSYYVQSNDFSGLPLPLGQNITTGGQNFKPDDVLHFSQVVWKDTTGVGCAFKNDCVDSKGNMGGVMHCIYTPAGNMGDEYIDQVYMPVPSAMSNS